MRLAASSAIGPSIAFVLASFSSAQITTRTTVGSANVQGNAASYPGGISDDGRFFAFSSSASNLVAGDTNGTSDVFLRDLWTGTTTLVSKSSAGVPGGSYSSGGAMSADGRYVVFYSSSNNLVPGDTNASDDIFRHDRLTGTTIRVSVDSSGAQANGYSDFHAISRDGNVVTFRSNATNLVPGVSSGWYQHYVKDIQSGATELLSQSTAGVVGNNHSDFSFPSEDGSRVAFVSFASNLVASDTNSNHDVFLRDRLAATTTRISVSTAGGQAVGGSTWAAISADGTLIAFESTAANLVPMDTNASYDVFLRDLLAGTTTRISLDSSGSQGNNSSFGPGLSPDGRFLTFSSWSSNLVAGDTNGWVDGFVRDLASGVTTRVTVSSAGAEVSQASHSGMITPDGRFVTMSSEASGLVSGDTNGVNDGFLRDRLASGFTELCEPGAAGVASCPCGNPPGGSGRGCDNSASTGGASLAASGAAYILTDSLVFTTSGQLPTATSIVLQGTSEVGAGLVFGQGVRCVGGSLKRLYVKAATGGSITAPDTGAGDASVSARSAALGDVISAGETRWYLVYYRDPIVLGGCPASSTFNATQTGRVAWSL